MIKIKLKNKEETKIEALKLQEDFSQDLHDLLQKYSVRDFFIVTGISLPYESPSLLHRAEFTAAVNMMAGDRIQLTKAFMAFMECSPDARELVNAALDAKEAGFRVGGEEVHSHARPDGKWHADKFGPKKD